MMAVAEAAEIAVVAMELAAEEIEVVVMELAAAILEIVDRVPVEVVVDTIGIKRKSEARVSGDHRRVTVAVGHSRSNSSLDNNRHRLK